MKKISSLIVFTTFILLTVQCHKEKESYVNAHFYCVDASDKGTLSLYIDGVNKGALPRPAATVSCEQSNLEASTLSLTLKSGKYELIVKDTLGNTVGESSYTFTGSASSGHCNKGSQSTKKTNDCVIVGLGTTN